MTYNVGGKLQLTLKNKGMKKIPHFIDMIFLFLSCFIDMVKT